VAVRCQLRSAQMGLEFGPCMARGFGPCMTVEFWPTYGLEVGLSMEACLICGSEVPAPECPDGP